MSFLPESQDVPDSYPVLRPSPDRDLFRFAGSVGRSGDNDRADVIKAQLLLGRAGYYDLPLPGMPTGWAGGGLEQAIRRFQKDSGLTADGSLGPQTFAALKQASADPVRRAGLQNAIVDRRLVDRPRSPGEAERIGRTRPGAWQR